jgi:ribose transport system ATP-binding protein
VRPAEPKRPIESLSGGNQQKVLLARWARRAPKVLLLEDPTRGVDVGARAEIWDLLVERADADGLAILVTSSDPEELSANCDRVLVLGRGRIHSVIEGSDITAARLTAASYEAENDEESA